MASTPPISPSLAPLGQLAPACTTAASVVPQNSVTAISFREVTNRFGGSCNSNHLERMLRHSAAAYASGEDVFLLHRPLSHSAATSAADEDAFLLGKGRGEKVKRQLETSDFSETLIPAIIGRFQNAVERMRQLGELNAPEILRISVTAKPRGFSTDFGNIIHFGIVYLLGLRGMRSAHALAGLHATIESQFFHELIHKIQYAQNDDGQELAPMLGEFCYDPANNARNRRVFCRSIVAKAIDKKIHGKTDESALRHYVPQWLEAARILLYEHARIAGAQDLPTTLAQQLHFLRGLHLLYEGLPEEALDGIMKKYIALPHERLSAISREMGEELGLLF